MRHVPRLAVPFLLLVALSLVSTGRHPAAAVSPAGEQALWGTYWTARPGFTSTLEMKNNLVGQALNISISLYLANGAEYPLNPLQLGPRQTAVIDLNRALAGVPNSSGPQTAREGTVEVTFDGPTPSALMGSVSVTNPDQGIAWNFFLWARRPDPAVVPIHGLFWFQNKQTDGFIALGNASEEFLSLTPRFQLSSGSYVLPQITLAPGLGTKLELRRELHKLGLDEVTAGGIEFTWQGVPDALKAHGVLFDGHGFSAEIDFLRLESNTENDTLYLRTPRFAVGKADPRLGLPKGTTFDPIVALHNFDAGSLNANLSVGYLSGGVTRQLSVPLLLAAGETRVFSLLPYLQGVIPPDDPWASLQVSYSDTQNGLATAMVSVSQEGEHSIRSVLNWTHGNLREGWYWSADADHDTFLSILNTDTEDAQLAISLDYYAEGTKKTYNLPEQTLSPGASSLLDIGQIIASGQPDADGNIIPAGVAFGGYRVRKVGRRLWATVTTEALAFDRRTENFLTFYNTCCGMVDTRFSPTSFLGPVGPLGAVTVMQQDYCTQQWVQVTSGCTFSSGNTAVSTVDEYGYVTGVAPGSTLTTTRVTYEKQRTVDTCVLWNISNNANTNVQTLASFTITVTSTPVSGETNSLVSGQSGQVQVQAKDNFGNVFTSYQGTVHFSSTDILATLPSDYTFTSADSGTHTFNLTLTTVAGTSATRDLTVKDNASGISSSQNINVWFQTTMDIERWKNCNFVSCPNPGSYFCQTACQPNGFSTQSQFVAITQSGLCNKGIVLKAQQSNGSWSASTSTTVQDCGPAAGGGCSNPYWNTGTIPNKGGCLSDLLATNLGVPNGCNGTTPFGNGTVLWRFQ